MATHITASSNMTQGEAAQSHSSPTTAKLHGRAFYESIGSPKYVLAPMVNQSEFAWRMLTRSFMADENSKNLLAYTPMLHAKHFAEMPKYREANFLPVKAPITPGTTKAVQSTKEMELYLDGNPKTDRPLFVQFCANDPDAFLSAAQHVQAHCDAVDLNLGCPQGIAKKGHYGAFLQEDWDLIYKLINKLHLGLDIPITAKFRIQETKEKTLKYAKMILNAGASIITVHGRQREQKGHNTGLADWSVIRYLRDQLPPETVIFANGNVLQHGDLQLCLKETDADGVMSAEGNLYDPTIFAEPPAVGQEGREYWRGKDGKGGYRMDVVMRRYLDILYRYVLEKEPPQRKPLFVATDIKTVEALDGEIEETDEPPRKKPKLEEAKKKQSRTQNPNFTAVQPHLFSLLRPLVTVHHDVRDALAKAKGGDMEQLEKVLALVEAAVKKGILEYETTELPESKPDEHVPVTDPSQSSAGAIARCRRPFFICQSYIRPLPAEAFAKGALSLSKKEKKALEDLQHERGNAQSKDTLDDLKPEPIRDGAGVVADAAVYG